MVNNNAFMYILIVYLICQEQGIEPHSPPPLVAILPLYYFLFCFLYSLYSINQPKVIRTGFEPEYH